MTVIAIKEAPTEAAIPAIVPLETGCDEDEDVVVYNEYFRLQSGTEVNRTSVVEVGRLVVGLKVTGLIGEDVERVVKS